MRNEVWLNSFRMTPGFMHVPYNDLTALEAAIGQRPSSDDAFPAEASR